MGRGRVTPPCVMMRPMAATKSAPAPHVTVVLLLLLQPAVSMSSATVSPAQLRALASISSMRTSLAGLPTTAALPGTKLDELRQAASSMLVELDALTHAVPSTMVGLDSPPPRLEASLLAEKLADEAKELRKVEEQQTTERASELFDLIDKSKDGLIQLEEFIGVAPAIFSPGQASEQQLREQMERLFRRVDLDLNESLDRAEFERLLSSLKSAAAAPLLASREAGLCRLLVLTMDVCGLSLAHELADSGTRRGRRDLREIESSVVRWCALAERTAGAAVVGAEVAERTAGAEVAGAEVAWAEVAGAEVAEVGRAEATERQGGQTSLGRLEALVDEASTLAIDLSLLQSRFDLRRHARLALSGTRASVRFCVRGLGIMANDLVKTVRLLGSSWFQPIHGIHVYAHTNT